MRSLEVIRIRHKIPPVSQDFFEVAAYPPANFLTALTYIGGFNELVQAFCFCETPHHLYECSMLLLFFSSTVFGSEARSGDTRACATKTNIGQYRNLIRPPVKFCLKHSVRNYK